MTAPQGEVGPLTEMLKEPSPELEAPQLEIDAEVEPDPAVRTGSSTPALSGLATAPQGAGVKKLDFEATTAEGWSWWSADVKQAWIDHPAALGLIDEALEDLRSKKVSVEAREMLGGRLTALRMDLMGLLSSGIAVKDRPAAIKLVSGAAAKVQLIVTDIGTAATEQAAADEVARQEAAERKAAAEKAEAEAEAKRKKEAAQKAEREKAEKLAAEREAAEQLAAEREAAEKKRKAEEAAEAKRAAAEKAEREEAERLAAEQQAAQEAEERKQKAAEAQRQRHEAFGDKASSLAASTKVGASAGEAVYESEMSQVKSTFTKDTEGLSRTKKVRGNKVYDAATAKRDAAKGRAAESRDAAAARVEDDMLAVLRSASGSRLGDDDLAWVITTANGARTYAQDLADVVAASSRATAAAIAKDPSGSSLAPVCAAYLGRGVAADLVLLLAQLVAKSKNPFGTWVDSLQGDELADAVDLAKDFPTKLPIVTEVARVLGTGTDAFHLIQALVKPTAKAKPDEVKALMARSADPGFADLCRTVQNCDVELSQVNTTCEAGVTADFTLSEVAALIGRHPQRLGTVTTLLGLADPHCVSYVSLRISIGTVSPMLEVAVRAEALLADGLETHATLLSIEQADRPYGRNGKYAASCKANDARTGFLHLQMPGQPLRNVHTHWNATGTTKGQMTSIHVQSNGSNGIELDEWNAFFPQLNAAVVAAHNAGTGTEKPSGGPLRL